MGRTHSLLSLKPQGQISMLNYYYVVVWNCLWRVLMDQGYWCACIKFHCKKQPCFNFFPHFSIRHFFKLTFDSVIHVFILPTMPMTVDNTNTCVSHDLWMHLSIVHKYMMSYPDFDFLEILGLRVLFFPLLVAVWESWCTKRKFNKMSQINSQFLQTNLAAQTSLKTIIFIATQTVGKARRDEPSLQPTPELHLRTLTSPLPACHFLPHYHFMSVKKTSGMCWFRLYWFYLLEK